MPRKPRNSPNKPGRPPKAREAAAKLVPAIEAGRLMPADAAAKAGVSVATIKAERARQRLVPVPRRCPPKPKAPSSPPPTPSAGTQGAPPGDPATADLDPLATLARVQRSLESDLAGLDVEAVAARRAIGAVLVQVSKAAEHILRGRPPADDEEERWKRDAASMLRRIRSKLPEILAARIGAEGA